MSEEISIKTYRFDELDPWRRDQAILFFSEHFDVDIEDMMKCELLRLLELHGIFFDKTPKLIYSLSYSQGDGVCFVGEFQYRGLSIIITHRGIYSHKRSAIIDVDCSGDDKEQNHKMSLFKTIYYEICDTLETFGYEEIEYQTSDVYVKDICESNGYRFVLKEELMQHGFMI